MPVAASLVRIGSDADERIYVLLIALLNSQSAHPGGRVKRFLRASQR
jgi:hypothetical protein